jgi:predicted nucleic acid-binding protein
VSAILAFFYLTSLDPVYRVETKLNEVQESSVSLGDSALTSLFNVNVQASSKNFDMFFWQLNSTQVAKKLWDEGFDRVYYSFALDEESGEFIYRSNFWQSLNNFIFNLEPKDTYNHNDLRNLINGKVNFLRDRSTRDLYVLYIDTTSPERDLALLQRLVKVTDEFIKERKLISINSKMEFLRDEARVTTDIDAKTSLNALVRQNLLEKSLLSGDGLLYFEVIEEPFIHEYPRVTSPTFVFVAFIFISWASSVLITYLRRNIV